MLLKLKHYNQPLAMGLIWSIVTPDEINEIKKLENLYYGFINYTEAGKKSRYRQVTFTNQEDNNAISFAGLLAAKYDNLIYVHRLNEHLYWLCVIKEHEVWNNMDNADGKTTGDILCDIDTAKQILATATRDVFGDNHDNINIRCSESAAHAFPNYQVTSIDELLEGTKAYQGRNKILLLDKYQLRVKRIVTIISILIIVLAILLFAYSKENAAARERTRLLALQQQAELKKQQKIQYTTNLQQRIKTQQGAIAIARALTVIRHLPVLSKGWRITNITYDLTNPHQAHVKLKRESYGDLLSFNAAYQSITIDQKANADNNSGSKQLQLKFKLPKASQDIMISTQQVDQILNQKYPLQRYKLIARAQHLDLPLSIEAESKGQYGYNQANLTISGQSLWNLSKFQYFLADFPTLFIKQVKLEVKDYNISWTLTGELYG